MQITKYDRRGYNGNQARKLARVNAWLIQQIKPYSLPGGNNYLVKPYGSFQQGDRI